MSSELNDYLFIGEKIKHVGYIIEYWLGTWILNLNLGSTAYYLCVIGKSLHPFSFSLSVSVKFGQGKFLAHSYSE